MLIKMYLLDKPLFGAITVRKNFKVHIFKLTIPNPVNINKFTLALHAYLGNIGV